MVVLLSALLFTAFTVISAQRPCITPDHKNGTCIELRQCKPLFDVLLKQPLLESDRKFLRQTKCDYSGGKVFVCCTEAATASKMDLLPKPSKCGHQLNDRILGGRDALDLHAWAGLIEYSTPNGTKGFHCGSVLINENYVLTAAHCINGAEITKRGYKVDSIRLGEYDLTKDPDCEYDVCADPVVDIPVAELIPHESYKPASLNQEHDIALIRLSHPVNFTDFIKPICLPLSSDNISNGTWLETFGWGASESVPTRSATKSKEGFEILPTSQCNIAYKKLKISIGENQMCVSAREYCAVDSGGSITAIRRQNYVSSVFTAGIKSFGPKLCGRDTPPDVYTRVDKYVDWIASKLKP